MGVGAVLKLEGALAVGLSMVVSLAVYAAAFGFQLAIGLLVLLLVHELGHMVACRVVGLKSSGPVFIPFLGALIRLNKIPLNAKTNANIAIGGPAAGTISALFCLVFYLWTDNILFLVLTYVACLLNLFNLIPCAPLDGEYIAAVISRRLLWLGSLALLAVFFYTHNFLVFLIFIFSLGHLWHRQSYEESFYLSKYQRLTLAWQYFGILAVLSVLTWYVMGLLFVST
ncbi:MAG: peptidase M50 [Sporomusaceae bacterium]|nr:peptidase M50 [Sporomusaceae bacterium]